MLDYGRSVRHLPRLKSLYSKLWHIYFFHHSIMTNKSPVISNRGYQKVVYQLLVPSRIYRRVNSGESQSSNEAGNWKAISKKDVMQEMPSFEQNWAWTLGVYAKNWVEDDLRMWGIKAFQLTAFLSKRVWKARGDEELARISIWIWC